MGALFSSLFAKIASVVRWFGDLFVAVFQALWDLLRDAVCWPFEQVLDIAVSALGAIDVSAITGQLGVFSQIPAGVVEVMAASGAGVCFSIIAGALAVRFVLQLIPFTRLGS